MEWYNQFLWQVTVKGVVREWLLILWGIYNMLDMSQIALHLVSHMVWLFICKKYCMDGKILTQPLPKQLTSYGSMVVNGMATIISLLMIINGI